MNIARIACTVLHNTHKRAHTIFCTFADSKNFSEITGVKEELILRLRTILKAIASGYLLDIDQFRLYCDQTYEYIMSNYAWYILPPTIHKVLIHGCIISEKFDLPLGSYSEEAQEAQNKVLRNARLSHTCKISRFNVMKNQFEYMLIRTDPVISSITFKKHQNIDGEPLDDAVKNLLKFFNKSYFATIDIFQ